jgi:hypothetical protein
MRRIGLLLLEGRGPAAARFGVAVLALVLALASLDVGFYTDDYYLRATLARRLAWNAPWWDLYHFFPRDRIAFLVEHGEAPWWTAPHLSLHLVRPLASALFTLDDALFKANPVGYHVHSLLWFAALLAVVASAYRRLAPPATATLAFAVYALSGANTLAFAWPSARHGLVAAVFGVAAVAAYVRWREEHRPVDRAVATACFVLALLGAESGLGAVLFGVAYDLAGPAAASTPERGRRAFSRERAVRALPLCGLAAAYLGVYALLGGGAHDSAGYISPVSDPVGFAKVAVVRLPVLIANALLAVPAEFSVIGLAVPLAIAGIVAALAMAALWRACAPRASEEERAAVRWLVPGAVASVLVGLGGFPGARLLVLPNLGFAYFLALLVRYGFATGRGAIPRRMTAGIVVALHFVLSPLGGFVNVRSAAAMARATERVAHDAVAAMRGAHHVFLLAASDPMVSMYAPAVMVAQQPQDGCWVWISGAHADMRIARDKPGALTLEPVGTSFLRAPFESLFRAPSVAWHAGDVARVCGGEVRVTALAGGDPSRIELAVDDPLDDPDVALLAWDGGRIVRLAPPPLGASRVIPWSTGPSGIF